jgi:hypothetical protein
VVGYILLGVGSVLVAALSVIAILGIRGVGKNVEELTSAPVPKRLV